jgi:hypothetical protein
MSENEKAVIRAALMWHAVNVLVGPDPRRKSDVALARACRRLLKAHPKRTYRRTPR